MANGIVDCTGRTINKGMKVRTDSGQVLFVCGGAVNDTKMYNAEACTIVPDDTPLTGEIPLSERPPTDNGTDCVVWGSIDRAGS